jgi:hypothetical protein
MTYAYLVASKPDTYESAVFTRKAEAIEYAQMIGAVAVDRVELNSPNSESEVWAVTHELRTGGR